MQTLFSLDNVLDGQGLTAKFSFDSTRLQIGGSKGNILVWCMNRQCLLYDIQVYA